MLMNVIIISGLIHVVGGLVLGGLTIVKYVIPDEAQFEEPPAVVEEEPPPEVKVEYKPQPQQQQQPMQNLRMKQIGNIAVANVDVNLPSMADNFTVSAGLGGVGNGSLLGGAGGSLNLGMSEVSVFGLKTRAERILFCIDTNRDMVVDKKGGLSSYNVIKEEITDMVGNLSPGTLFNVMVFDRRRVLFFKPKIVPATKQAHTDLVKWIAQFNTNAQNVGLQNKSNTKYQYKQPSEDIVFKSMNFTGFRENESHMMTQVILEQNVDAAFIITGFHRGVEHVRRPWTAKEDADWEKHISSKAYQEEMAKHKAEIPQMEKRVQNTLAQINADRRKKGMPERVLSTRHGVYSNANELQLKWNTPHPGWKPHYDLDTRKTYRYFKQFIDTNYLSRDANPPSINIVLFLAGDEIYKPEWERSLKTFIRFFKGKYRVIRGGNEIKSARSAKNTTNKR
ncbi:hypothetical protein Caka_2966 [Coraliomargarita akajimensis DSM 45221]|uniref:Uncharacterized protein n=2 Tax=Coraliomargarita TaxID=442430 RepID=D5ERD5_CORAD|nr:hypothetical protein Caka_2966 [Coraliomargarita akajimensis DSM 45221]